MYVLRKKPPGKLVPSAHQVDREFRVISALAADRRAGAAPTRCATTSVIGQMFYLMEFVPGRILIDAAMPGMTPAERATIFDSMNDVLARLHKVDSAPSASATTAAGPVHRPPDRALDKPVRARDRGHPGDGQAVGLAARATSRRRRDDHRPRRLSAGQPDRASQRAAHRGGARLGTVDARPPAVRHRLQLPGLSSRRAAASASPGSTSRRSACRPRRNMSPPTAGRTGRAEIPNWNYYLAFSLFRLAAIAQGVYSAAWRAMPRPTELRRPRQVRPTGPRCASLGWSLVKGRALAIRRLAAPSRCRCPWGSSRCR